MKQEELKQIIYECIDSLRDYEHKSGHQTQLYERETGEFVDIFLKTSRTIKAWNTRTEQANEVSERRYMNCDCLIPAGHFTNVLWDTEKPIEPENLIYLRL
jgi:hypothetical protein